MYPPRIDNNRLWLIFPTNDVNREIDVVPLLMWPLDTTRTDSVDDDDDNDDDDVMMMMMMMTKDILFPELTILFCDDQNDIYHASCIMHHPYIIINTSRHHVYCIYYYIVYGICVLCLFQNQERKYTVQSCQTQYNNNNNNNNNNNTN